MEGKETSTLILTKTDILKRIPYKRAVCYSGFRSGQSPQTGIYPSEEETLEDLRLLVECGFSYIRMYEPNLHAQRTLQAIRQHQLPLQAMVGIDPRAEISNPDCPWDRKIKSEAELLENAAYNDKMIEELIVLANLYQDELIAVSVGNENRPSWGSDLVSEDRLIEQARKLKASTQQLVTYNEGAYEWLSLERLVRELDLISIHSYPLWHRTPLEDAIRMNQEDYKQIVDKYPDKLVLFSELGWATQCNERMDKQEVSEEKQAEYLRRFLDWADEQMIVSFIFEAFDEPWKGSNEPEEPEKHWGIFKEDRTNKIWTSYQKG